MTWVPSRSYASSTWGYVGQLSEVALQLLGDEVFFGLGQGDFNDRLDGVRALLIKTDGKCATFDLQSPGGQVTRLISSSRCSALQLRSSFWHK